MAKKRKQTAGQSRKSHKSRKTEPSVPGSGPSSTAIATVPPSTPTALDQLLADKGDKHSVVDTPTPAIVPSKQWWYRPADSKARKIVDKIVVHRAAGRSDADIAKLVKTTEASVRQYVYLARKNGWLDDEDAPVDLEAELALDVDRKVVRNIGAALDGQMTNWQTHEMTMAAAKGRGIFKTHEKSDGAVQTALPVVAIQVIMPTIGAEDQRPEITEADMGGVPAYTDGEVEEDEQRLLTANAGPEAPVGAES